MSSDRILSYIFLVFLLLLYFGGAPIFLSLLLILLVPTLINALGGQNPQKRKTVSSRYFKKLCPNTEGVHERSTLNGVNVQRFAFRLGKRPVRMHYRSKPEPTLEVLEIRIRVRQKFWLLLNRKKSVEMIEDRIFTGVKWLDDSYVIQSNQPEAAKDFWQRFSIQHYLRIFTCSFDKLEIVRGEICLTLHEPSLWNMNRSHLTAVLYELQKIVEQYEQHEIILLRISPLQSLSHCPYCRNSFESSEVLLRCKNCNTQIHESCWNENGQCTTWGCLCTPAISALV